MQNVALQGIFCCPMNSKHRVKVLFSKGLWIKELTNYNFEFTGQRSQTAAC